MLHYFKTIFSNKIIRIKAVVILLFLLTLIYGCGVKSQKPYPDYVLGINKNTPKKKYDKDSLNIVTPSIEIFKQVNNIKSTHYNNREIARAYVIETLKHELNKTAHFELEMMIDEYLAISKVLEEINYKKYKHPELITKAPNELLISENKYTLLVTIAARNENINNGVLYFCVINNYSRLIESVSRCGFSGNPSDNNQNKEEIKEAILNITMH